QPIDEIYLRRLERLELFGVGGIERAVDVIEAQRERPNARGGDRLHLVQRELVIALARIHERRLAPDAGIERQAQLDAAAIRLRRQLAKRFELPRRIVASPVPRAGRE